MSVPSLPHDLASLIHHVELSKAGWRERALELLVLASVGEGGTGVSVDGVYDSVNARLSGPLGRAQVEQKLDSLQADGRVIRLADGQLKLSEAARNEFHDILQEAKNRTANVEAYFERLFGDLPDEAALSWDVFQADFLIPLVTELGAKTYQILTGESVEVEEASAYVGFLSRFPKASQSTISDRISRFVDPKSPPVRSYVLRLLNTAFLVKAITLSETAMDALLERTKKRLRLRIFVDTNFLFSLIGLHENPADDVVDALHELIERMRSRVDVKLYMLPCTMDEATKTIAGYQDRLSGFHFSRSVAKALREGTADLNGITLRYIQEASKSGQRMSAKEYFAPYLDNFIEVARSKGVELYNAPVDDLRTDQAVIDDLNDRMEFEERTRPIERRKSYELLLHDMVLWHFTRRTRPARVDSPLDAESWVVTIDFGLLGFDAHKRRRTPTAPSVCIHPTVLLQVLQLWVPTSDKMNAALMDSLRPMLPHSFDREAEQVTVRILSTLSRFENSDDLGAETVTNILLSEAVRSRVSATKDVAEETEIIRTALAEQNRLLELRAKRLDQQSQGLELELKERDQEILALQGEIQRLSDKGVADRDALDDAKSEREELAGRLDAIETGAAVREAYTATTVVGVGCGALAAVVSWFGGTQIVSTWPDMPLVTVFALGGLVTATVSFAAASVVTLRSEVIRLLPGGRRVRTIAKTCAGLLFGSVVVGLVVEGLGSGIFS